MLSNKRSIQKLPPKMAQICAVCHLRVHFKVRSSVKGSRSGYVIEYLRCPKCGSFAQRYREIGAGDTV